MAPKPRVPLLTHSPGPGLYSRLGRAVEALPPTVKVEGLENRLKKFKEGVAGWELGPVMGEVEARDAIGPDAGSPRKDISRKELLDIVHRVSPAFTHRQVELSEGPATHTFTNADDMFRLGGPLGRPAQLGGARFSGASEGLGENYRVQLLMQGRQPKTWDDNAEWRGGHWTEFPGTIAHMRTRDVGDALRINELQSDIRNQNVEELAQQKELHEDQFDAVMHGMPIWPTSQIPLYDAYPEVLLKSALLDAAQGGKRALEIPPLSSIGQYVGMRPEGIKHVYGGQVPNTLMRVARPLGGLIDAVPATRQARLTPELDALIARHNYLLDQSETLQGRVNDASDNVLRMAGLIDESGNWPGIAQGEAIMSMVRGKNEIPRHRGDLAGLLHNLAWQRALVEAFDKFKGQRGPGFYGAAQRWRGFMNARNHVDMPRAIAEMTPRMPAIMREVELASQANQQARLLDIERRHLTRQANRQFVGQAMVDLRGEMHRYPGAAGEIPAPSRRLEISDDMRRRIIQQGIGLGILAPLLSPQEEKR